MVVYTIQHKPVAGTIEVGWYFPSATNNTFQDAVTFVNVHGDDRHFPRQMKFLSKVMYVLCISK